MYLAPLVNGKLITPTIVRIARDTMFKEESRIFSDLPLLAVDPPEGFFEILPVARQTPSKEFKLLAEFYDLCGSLNKCRNTLYFVNSRLNQTQPFERELAEKYQRRLQDEVSAI